MSIRKDLVIQAENLSQFIKDAPAQANLLPLRLMVSEIRRPNPIMDRVLAQIDLMGLSLAEHVVWFHWSIDLQSNSYSGDFLSDYHASLYQAIPHVSDALKVHLEAIGYRVTGGRYGLDSSIRPLKGDLEIIKLGRSGDRAVVEAKNGTRLWPHPELDQ